tara:strand:+ start:13177 stop:13908 length:732 start_codon:yes stop_codon:yes gene_type:complete
MIKFFRKIRQNLVAENRFSKYFLYATGEIILVVIGILIALQINNWNQYRIAKNKEKVLLSELHQEFLNNKTQLDTVVSYHIKSLASVDSIIALFPIDIKALDLEDFVERKKYSAYHWTFNPSNGVVNSLINTSSFDLISNDSLRKLLITWKEVLVDYQEEEIRSANNLINNIIPYLGKNMPLENNDRFNRKNLAFLETWQYENQIHIRKRAIVNIIGENTDELSTLKHFINEIIKFSKPKIND